MSTTAEKTEEKPVVLIVEDDKDKLDIRSRLFNRFGFQAIGAIDQLNAMKEFRSLPTMDLVVMDVNLDQDNDQDRTGVTIAKEIKKLRPGLPVVALSGKVDSLSKEERTPFTQVFIKANPDSNVKDSLPEWRRLAIEYRKQRAQKAKDELKRVRQAYEMPSPDVNVLRDFVPGAVVPEHQFESNDVAVTPDELLRKAGWRLRLVEAGGVRVQDMAEKIKTLIVIPVWLKREDSTIVAVLHEHNSVYHDVAIDEHKGLDDPVGLAETQAVEGALQLMYGFYLDFVGNPTEACGAELASLRTYLFNVFGNPINSSDKATDASDEEGREEGSAKASGR